MHTSRIAEAAVAVEANFRPCMFASIYFLFGTECRLLQGFCVDLLILIFFETFEVNFTKFSYRPVPKNEDYVQKFLRHFSV